MYRSKLLFVFSVVNLISVFISILFMRFDVAFKFNSGFVVTEMVSRWYDIILPILQLISCFIILFIDIKQGWKIPHFYRYIVAYIAVSISTYYTWIMIAIHLNNYQIGDKISLPITVLIIVPIALFFLVYSYYLIGKNYKSSSLFAFKWVRLSPVVWKKTHYFAGTMGIICSALMMGLAILNDTIFRTNWIYIVVIIIWGVLYYLSTFIYSKKIYKKINQI